MKFVMNPVQLLPHTAFAPPRPPKKMQRRRHRQKPPAAVKPVQRSR